jgi:tetratricopeptide (TPR) repeat protein
MYLKGSNWSYNKRRRRSNPIAIILLLVLIGAAAYINFVIVPTTSPLFIPTPTPTRSAESYTADAQALENEGKFSQAIDAFKLASQVDPKNASNFLSMARLMIWTGRYDEALEQAGNALLINPNNSAGYALRGLAYGMLSQWLDATGSLEKAIALDPNNAVAFAYLAEVYANQYQSTPGDLGLADKAIEASRTAQSLNENLMETHRARGLVLEITDNRTEAMAEYEAAIALNGNISNLHIALGRIYRAEGFLDQAKEQFNSAISLNPFDPEPLLYLSRTYLTAGELGLAAQYAESAIKLAPNDPFYYGNLGQILYQNDLFSDSIAPLRVAVRGGLAEDGSEVKGLPLDYGRVAEYYYTYGLALARTGECGEALQISNLLIQGVPSDEIAVYNATEMNNLCQQVAEGDVTATPTVTPTP